MKANTSRWIGPRGVYRDLRERADTAEKWHAVTLAAGALDTKVDAREVSAEMKVRVYFAMRYIDDFYPDDNGVAPEVISAPMPASVEDELPY